MKEFKPILVDTDEQGLRHAQKLADEKLKLKCPDHDLGSQNVNEVGYCKIVENSSAKLIEDCIECVYDNLDSVDNITTFEYVVVDDELRVTSISKNSEGSTIGTNFESYIKTSQPFSCECNE